MEDLENTPDFREKVAQSFADDMEELAQKAAEAEGQPMKTRKVSDARAVRLYGLRDQNVDAQQMLTALLTTGLPAELLSPENPQAPLIIRERPELAEYYGRPAQTSQAAEHLVQLAEYPWRYGLIMDEDNPRERVRYADHLDRLWQQSMPQADATPIDLTATSAQSVPIAPPQPSLPVAPSMPAPSPLPLGG